MLTLNGTVANIYESPRGVNKTTGEAFGEARLAHSLASPRSEDLIARLRAALTTHLAGTPAHDDISILVIDCPA